MFPITGLSDKDVADIIDVLVPALPRIVVAQTASDPAMPVEGLVSLPCSKLFDLALYGRGLVSASAAVGSSPEAVTEGHHPHRCRRHCARRRGRVVVARVRRLYV